jgi:hypothetical protein
LGSGIGKLLGEVGFAGAASTQSTSPQKIVEVAQSRQRDPRLPNLHADAGRGIEHPRRHHHHDPRGDLEMDETPRHPVLATLNAKLAAVQRMPSIMNDDLLPDMGRMNRC